MSGDQELGPDRSGDEVRWFGDFELEAVAANQDELAGAIRDFMRDRHGIARQELDRSMSVYPLAGRMHSVVLDPPTTTEATLTARIPAGTAGRRDALAGIGWAIEKASTGTRYYTRRFVDADRAPEDAARAIVEAGELLYGDRAKGIGWSVQVAPMHLRTAGTVQRSPGAAQEWQMQLAGTSHRVVLGKGPRAFLVDGVEHHLGPLFKFGARTAVFDLGGHPASLTWSNLSPSPAANFLRRFRTDRTFGLPLTILVSALFGAGAGGGAAAATSLEAMVKGWRIYDLVVDGKSRGCWVLCLGGGQAIVGWVFVRPGEPLPQRDWIHWPALPAPSASEIARNRRVGTFLKAALLLIVATFVLGVLFLPGGILNGPTA